MTNRRWKTRFGSWVKGYGARQLARDIGVAVHGMPLATTCVYQWVSGYHTPRPEHAQAIVRLSGGRVRLEDVFGVKAVLAGKTATEDRVGRPIAGPLDSTHGRRG